jgi:radical SAM protein with 4Fe4S-binding SPASM domain
MSSWMQEIRRYLPYIGVFKLWNALVVWISFYTSRIFKHSMHPGLPIGVSIEPTTACNLGCPECPSGLKMFSRRTGNLRLDDYMKWMDGMAPHLIHLNLYFQGEPFIHPEFLQLVSYAHRRKIFTSTSTNGHFFTDEIARQTVESGLDRVIISVDGTTQEVYQQYRVHGKLEKVLEGTRRLMAQRTLLKKRTPQVIFQFLVVAPNEHQIPEVLALAEEIGVDEVRFKTAQVYDYVNGNPLIPSNERYSRYLKLSDGTYRVKNALDNQCWRMWSGCVITWDGRVVPCCFDKDATHALGQLENENLHSIWNGQAYRSFRKFLMHSRADIDICSNCSEGTRVWTEA